MELGNVGERFPGIRFCSLSPLPKVRDGFEHLAHFVESALARMG
jgi:hypothetical protein